MANHAFGAYLDNFLSVNRMGNMFTTVFWLIDNFGPVFSLFKMLHVTFEF